MSNGQVSSKSVRLVCTGVVDGRGRDPSGPRAEFQILRCCSAGDPQLEAALAALGNSTGPEVVALQQALKKARIDAEGMPLATQLKECQLFVERKEKKIASIDQESCSRKAGPVWSNSGRKSKFCSKSHKLHQNWELSLFISTIFIKNLSFIQRTTFINIHFHPEPHS